MGSTGVATDKTPNVESKQNSNMILDQNNSCCLCRVLWGSSGPIRNSAN